MSEDKVTTSVRRSRPKTLSPDTPPVPDCHRKDDASMRRPSPGDKAMVSIGLSTVDWALETLGTPRQKYPSRPDVDPPSHRHLGPWHTLLFTCKELQGTLFH